MTQYIEKKTSYGTVRGIQMNGYQEYRGIRYATAERFQKPIAVNHAEGVYDATRFGYSCPQTENEEGTFYWREFYSHTERYTSRSEDCLNLNIWTPDHAENLPVAIWIHGGAFLGGWNSKVEIDGEYWNKRGVVLVSINYRVGALGFLNTKELEERFGYAGNLGIYDQLCAVKWIHEHIADFGGNPDHITLCGQSAGAMSVQTLVVSPLLPDYIVGAIMQSGGGIHSPFNYSLTNEEEQGWHEKLMELCGVKNVDELLKMDATELAVKFAEHANSVRPGLSLLPHIDPELMPGSYEELVETGKVKNIPMLIGVTKNDLFIWKNDPFETAFFQGCIKEAAAKDALGHAPGYTFIFAKDPLGGDGEGCFHSSDMWYTFHRLNVSWREKDADDWRVADEMALRWIRFIQTGNPNDPTLEEWKPCTAEADNTRIFR